MIYVTENKTDPMIKRFGAAWTSYNWEQKLMGKRVLIKFTREVGTIYTVFIDRKSTSYPLLLVGVNVDEGFARIVEYVDIEEWNTQVKLKSKLELLRSYFKHLPDCLLANEDTVRILKAIDGLVNKE
jgi:hypothetical protein